MTENTQVIKMNTAISQWTNSVTDLVVRDFDASMLFIISDRKSILNHIFNNEREKNKYEVLLQSAECCISLSV